MITWYVIFPILVIAATGITWLIFKLNVSPWKRVGVTAIGVFAFIGFAVVLLGVYFQTNKVFASSFRFYGYSALAEANPFDAENGDLEPALMRWGVFNEDGTFKLYYHPNPEAPTESLIFAPGKYILAQLEDGVLTIPQDVPNSEPRITHTSLWWALTKDLYRLSASAN